ELATSFNPGDNFRVLASMNETAIHSRSDFTGVPTTGGIINFPGVATPQLSIWRRMHIEQDRLAAIPWSAAPTAGNATTVNDVPNRPDRFLVATNLNLQANQFAGGTLYQRVPVGGQTYERPYQIVSHTAGANSVLTIQVWSFAGRAPRPPL